MGPTSQENYYLKDEYSIIEWDLMLIFKEILIILYVYHYTWLENNIKHDYYNIIHDNIIHDKRII